LKSSVIGRETQYSAGVDVSPPGVSLVLGYWCLGFLSTYS
jgi:hypothetical protein